MSKHSSIVDEQAQRQTRARAIAASILSDEEIRPQPLAPLLHGRLQKSSRRRQSRLLLPALPSLGGHVASRRVTAIVLMSEFVAMLFLLISPTFHTATVSISGDHALTSQQILGAAGLSSGQNIFTVDGQEVRNRIAQLPWVEDVTVSMSLPNTISITVVEWPPVLRWERGGTNEFVSETGAIAQGNASLDTSGAGLTVIVDSRLTLPPGGNQLDPLFIRTLQAMDQQFRGAYGCGIAFFEWQSDGVFDAATSCRWRLVFGHMDSHDEIAGIPAQLAALSAVQHHLSLTHPNFGYIDVENPNAPAIGGHPGAALAVPPPLTAAPSATPTPVSSTVPSPTVTATPTNQPIIINP